MSVRLLSLSEVSLAEKPFYQRWWFLVIIALIGIIIVLIVVGVLYITGKKRQRRTKSLSSLPTFLFTYPSLFVVKKGKGAYSC